MNDHKHDNAGLVAAIVLSISLSIVCLFLVLLNGIKNDAQDDRLDAIETAVAARPTPDTVGTAVAAIQTITAGVK